MIGAGSVARRHIDVLTRLPDVRIVAVADPVAASAESVAAGCGARPFTSVDDALDSGPADAAYVCVPPFAHGAPEEAVLDRRLPMFVEKPVAIDLPTAERLSERVLQAGVVTGTGYHWRCLDVVDIARDLLRQAPAVLANGYWLDKRPPVAWWGWMNRSGGQVVEQLTHVLDMARFLLGEAEQVYAAAGRSVGSDPQAGDVDDATAATVRFDTGAVATFSATSLLSAKHTAGLRTVSRGLLLELSETGLLVNDGGAPRAHSSEEDPKVRVDADFIAAVRGETDRTQTRYEDVVQSHRLACAVAESAATGQPVSLTPCQP